MRTDWEQSQIARMDFQPAIWNVLHDGHIVGVRSAIPGTVQVDVSIDYLRERFAVPGKVIQITLTGCKRFAYRDFYQKEFTEDFSRTTACRPQINCAELQDGLCTVQCNEGDLEVIAADGSLCLDSGQTVTLQELLDVANAYWAGLRTRSKQAKQVSGDR